ncbi:hypothetical protein CN692_04585 [Bacillus sp. AFS002410]|uniref:hypothetical protein n=1 Tax=Bacillus sp. AFS002410 TaxID=2033481 RepID=UPI000BF0F87D|nr:hypothetical protein [Bacillus sp. AFS002410]PEJ59478.1 hypothetical protein CN692_04585 [Bacillus sp. AFS002410]
MAVLKVGEFYVWTLNSHEKQKVIRKKVELVKVTEEVIDFEESGQVFTDDVFHFLVWKNGKAVELFSERRTLVGTLTPIERRARCYKCSYPLERKIHDICEDCGWIKCPIEGACGCKYL